MKPTDEEIAAMAKELGKAVAKLLRQELKWYDQAWWLFTLGKPARKLTVPEVKAAIAEGRINPLDQLQTFWWYAPTLDPIQGPDDESHRARYDGPFATKEDALRDQALDLTHLKNKDL